MKHTASLRILACFLIAFLLLPCALLPVAAAEIETVYIEDTFEQFDVTSGNVPDKCISADYAGSTNYAIVGDALAGNRSALVNDHVDWRWWARSISAETLTIAYKVKALPSDSLSLTVCMTVDGDASTSNEGLGGALTVIYGDGTELGLYDRNGTLITALEYGTVYDIRIQITSRRDTFTLVVNGQTFENIPYASAVYTVTAFRVNASAGSSFYFDDFKVSSTSRTYPQKYSAQEPGNMMVLDYPTYYESEGMTLWLNRDGTEAGKGAVKLDIPVKEANNTLYLPYDAVKAQLPVNNEIEYDPNIITWDGTPYIHIQDVATLMDGKVWWDEAEKMVVFTVGERKTDGILRNINGRFYMNARPYYEISFNKFDLAAQILINYFPEGFRDFNIGEDQRANAERALKELSDNGFTTIRFFSYVETYDMLHDPIQSEKYWKGLDELYDLCDKYGIKVVPSLWLGSDVMTACEYVEGIGYVSIGEDRMDLITNPESKSRAFQKAYIETYINRYKDRDTVLMWEINNEMNLGMDIGPSVGAVTYSAYQLSEFYKWCTSIIRECDPDRLVTSGDSVQRNSNYHLLAGTMAGQDANDWSIDSYAQRLYMNFLIHGLGGMDATSVHAYGENTDELPISEGRLNTTASRMSLSVMMDEARALGQPLYVGEAGTGTAHGNTDYTAIQKTLDGYVKLGLQLVHWWSYDTCRQPSFGDDNDWNMNMTDFPDSVAMIKAANEALKVKWLVNRADEDVVVTDTGDSASTETPTAAPDTSTDTDKPADPTVEDTEGTSETTPAEKKGCASSLSALIMTMIAAAAYTLVQKRGE
jgi:hypothetical protein